MSPSICSHVILGKRHGPVLTGFQTTPVFFTQVLEGFGPRPTWLSTDSGPRLECFPPRTGTSKHIFARVLAGFRSTALCGGPAQRFGRWRPWDLYKKNTIASNGRQASKARAAPPNPSFLKPRCALANVVQSRMLFGYCRSKSSA